MKRHFPLGAMLVLFAGALFGQPRFEYRAQILTFQQQVSRISWRLAYPDHTEEIAQTRLPVVFDFALARHSHLFISTAASWSEAALPSRYAMNGVTDAQARFTRRFGQRWMMSAGVNVPTGNSKLDYDENVVANRLTESILGFPLQRLGAGTDVEFSLAHALNLSESLGLGLGGTFLAPGEFEFRQQQADTYKPGSRYIFTATLNHIGATLPWRLSMLAQFYGTDQLNRQNFFQQGWQLEPALALEWRLARGWELGVGLRHIWKDENEIMGSPGSVKPPEHFYIDNSSFALLDLSRSWSRRVQAGLQLGWNHFGKSNQQLSRATIWRCGLKTSAQLSEHFIVNVSGDCAVGSAENGAVDVRGYGASFTFSARF